MNATPIADLLQSVPAAPGSADKTSAVDLLFAQLDAAGTDPRAASTFAALLQDAALDAERELPADERSSADAQVAEPAPGASALDTLLFLANVPASAPIAPDAADAAEAAAGSASRTNGLAAAASRGASRMASPEEPAPDAGNVDAQALEASVADIDDNLLATPKTTSLPVADTAATTPAPIAASIESPSFSHHVQPSSAASTASVDLPTPVGDPNWRYEAAERLANLVTRGIDRAELRVTPAELGPVEVRIDLRGNEATLSIVAVQAATRDALEQALPALRDLLSQQGLSLGEATVRDGRADGGASHEHGASTRATFDDGIGRPRSDEPAAVTRRVPRLVDTFA